MKLRFQSPDGNHHALSRDEAIAFLGCSRRTLDNYRHGSNTPGARLLRAHATGRLLPDRLGIWYCRQSHRMLTDTGAVWEVHEITQHRHWASVQAATIADLKTQLNNKETETMTLKRALAALTCSALAACASGPDPKDYPAHVAPLPGGEYSATATDSNPQTAQQSAIVYARAQCADIAPDRQPAIIDAKHDSNEPQTTGAKWGSSLAQAGAAVYAHNTNRVYIPPSYTYRTTLRFSCDPIK